MPFLETRALEKTYRAGRPRPVRALDGVDLAAEAGERVAVLGASGSGKSTLLNCLGGLDHPTSGEVVVDGNDLTALRPAELAAFRASTVGFVFQSFHLQKRFLAWENVALPLVFAGVDRRERRRRALELLDRVGLAERADHRPGELSGGEQQRVALARGLVRDPALLLADEPTGNLDSRTGRQILDLLVEVGEAGTTVLVVTHDEALARAFAPRLVRMADGRVVEDAEVAP
jgi:putative ABC transport system ATP-binding protein